MASVCKHFLEKLSPGYLDKKRVEFNLNCRPDRRSGCLLWVGGSCGRRPQLGPGPRTYGALKLTEKKKKHTTSAHVFAYFLHTGQVPVKNVWDISHLCHNPRCVLLDHLARERHNVNMSRIRCKQTRICQGHGNAEKPEKQCIF